MCMDVRFSDKVYFEGEDVATRHRCPLGVSKRKRAPHSSHFQILTREDSKGWPTKLVGMVRTHFSV